MSICEDSNINSLINLRRVGLHMPIQKKYLLKVDSLFFDVKGSTEHQILTKASNANGY